jgi:predicted transcriptional regulator
MISNGQPIQQLLTRLIRKTRGGDTRTQILKALKENPQNTNQLATRLKKSYKTIQHHISVLKKNKLITPIGENYATTYFLSQPMEENYEVFQEMANGKSCKKKRTLLFN